MQAIAKPFGLLLMFLYEFIGNYGVAIIIFALIVKIILLPFQMKAKRSQMQQQRIQPRVKELQKKHAANKQVLQQETTKLYREEGVSMTGGCLWTFLPLPIMLALYYAIREPITTMMGVPESFLIIDKVTNEAGLILQKLREVLGNPDFNIASGVGQIKAIQEITSHWDIFSQFRDIGLRPLDFSFLGINLGLDPTWKFWTLRSLQEVALFIIPLLSAGLSLLSSILSRKQIKIEPDPDNPSAAMSGKMMYLMGPVMSLLFGFSMPVAISLYWAIGTLLDLIRDQILFQIYTKRLDAEDLIKNEARLLKEAELEQKRIETERLRAENATEVNKNTSKDKRRAAERSEREKRRLEYEREHGLAPEPELDPGREGNRRYARGRAYIEDRYGSSAPESDELPAGDDIIEPEQGVSE